MISKKGSHVGIVLSFVIFITFLVFVYSTLEPVIKKDESKKELLENVEAKINENITAELIEVVMKQVVSGDDSCDELHAGDLGPLPKNDDYYYYLIKELKVFISEENINSWTGLPFTCTEDMKEIGKIGTKEYIFLVNVEDLAGSYQDNYEQVKEEFEITEGNFDFSFEEEDGTITSVYANGIPEEMSIYASEDLVQYVDDEANIKTGKLIIRVW